MSTHKKHSTLPVVLSFLLTSLLSVLSSCSPVPEQQMTASPSPDIDLVSTFAVETFQAQLTAASLAKPATQSTSTPTPPGSGATPAPTQPPQTVDTEKYRAVLIYQNPEDRSDIIIDEHFDMIWTVRNMGKEVWNENYKLRFAEGWPLGKYETVNLDRLVYPNEDVDIIVDMVAPPRPETAVSYWHLVNDRGETFYTLSVRINAILRPTVTKTPK